MNYFPHLRKCLVYTLWQKTVSQSLLKTFPAHGHHGRSQPWLDLDLHSRDPTGARSVANEFPAVAATGFTRDSHSGHALPGCSQLKSDHQLEWRSTAWLFLPTGGQLRGGSPHWGSLSPWLGLTLSYNVAKTPSTQISHLQLFFSFTDVRIVWRSECPSCSLPPLSLLHSSHFPQSIFYTYKSILSSVSWKIQIDPLPAFKLMLHTEDFCLPQRKSVPFIGLDLLKMCTNRSRIQPCVLLMGYYEEPRSIHLFQRQIAGYSPGKIHRAKIKCHCRLWNVSLTEIAILFSEMQEGKV